MLRAHPRRFGVRALATVALVALTLAACRPAAPTGTSPSNRMSTFAAEDWGLRFSYPAAWGEFMLRVVATNGVQPVLFGVFSANPDVTFVATNTRGSTKLNGFVERDGVLRAVAVDRAEVEIPRDQVLRTVRARNTNILLFKEADPSDKHTGLLDAPGSWVRGSIFHLLSTNRTTLEQFEALLRSVEVTALPES